MKSLILFAMLSPLLQGCVGVAVLKPHTEMISDPVIGRYWHHPDAVSKRNSSKATNAVVYTSEWLHASWGTPNNVTHISGGIDEVWTYRLRPIWGGVVPFVIIPIPLALPVAREKVCFTLRDGRVVSASMTKPWMVGGVAGFMFSPEGGGNFGASFFNATAPN